MKTKEQIIDIINQLEFCIGFEISKGNTENAKENRKIVEILKWVIDYDTNKEEV